MSTQYNKKLISFHTVHLYNPQLYFTGHYYSMSQKKHQLDALLPVMFVWLSAQEQEYQQHYAGTHRAILHCGHFQVFLPACHG